MYLMSATRGIGQVHTDAPPKPHATTGVDTLKRTGSLGGLGGGSSVSSCFHCCCSFLCFSDSSRLLLLSSLFVPPLVLDLPSSPARPPPGVPAPRSATSMKANGGWDDVRASNYYLTTYYL